MGIHGLYKLSDILYYWAPRVKDDEARTILTAGLKSISKSGSYLYNEGTGIELKLGMSSDGSKRFLIPSRQIEWLRYRLCLENELNPSRIPLPSSESFVDLSEYVHVTPTTYADPAELTREMRKFHRHSQSKKRTGDGNISNRDRTSTYFERIRSEFDNSKKGAQKVRYVAVDVESWELDHRLITEIGYCQLKFEDKDEVIAPGHIVITDHTNYKNGNYIVDNRFKFKHGKSQQLNLQETRAFFKELLVPIENEKVVMVMHGVKNDLLSLDILLRLTGRKHDAQVAHYSIPAQTPSQKPLEVEVIDTNRLLGCLGSNLDKVSLIDLSRILKVNVPRGTFETRDYFHNAGNDAYVTLTSFISFASGLTLERQREQLVPSIQTILTPSVEEPTEKMEDSL